MLLTFTLQRVNRIQVAFPFFVVFGFQYSSMYCFQLRLERNCKTVNPIRIPIPIPIDIEIESEININP